LDYAKKVLHIRDMCKKTKRAALLPLSLSGSPGSEPLRFPNPENANICNNFDQNRINSYGLKHKERGIAASLFI